MTLVLHYQAETRVPVEVEGITPAVLRGKSLREIEMLPIHHGNREVPLSQLFAVSGDAGDGHLVFQGELAGVHWIGARMTAGRIDVRGSAGRHLGSEMFGGEIHVSGNVGDWAGAEMRGGLLHVRGDAGDQLAAAYRGSPRGMTGGTILVHGRAGHEAASLMRRGLVAIGGGAGDFLGYGMLAGTLLVFGSVGVRPGAEMRRGTIGLFGETPPTLLPTFRHGCRFRPPMLQLLGQQLTQLDFPVSDAFASQLCDLYNGDFLAHGRGEILLPA